MLNLLIKLLSAQMQTNTMVIHKGATDLGPDHQQWQQHGADEHVCLRGDLARVRRGLLVLPEVPAVQVRDEHDIVDDGVRDAGLDPRHHGALLLALGVLLPRSAVLADHADQLLVSGHDGRHGGDQARAEEEVRQARDVEQGRGRAEAAGQELGPDVDCRQGVEDVETPRECVEGDREVDEGWMGGVAARSPSVSLERLPVAHSEDKR